MLTIWEIPVLEPGWASAWNGARFGPDRSIALAGFADRAVVARARAGGAVACLELPCDLDDLIDAVDRAVRSTPTGIVARPASGRAAPRVAAGFPSSRPSPRPFGGLRRHGQIADRCLESPDGQ